MQSNKNFAVGRKKKLKEGEVMMVRWSCGNFKCQHPSSLGKWGGRNIKLPGKSTKNWWLSCHWGVWRLAIIVSQIFIYRQTWADSSTSHSDWSATRTLAKTKPLLVMRKRKECGKTFLTAGTGNVHRLGRVTLSLLTHQMCDRRLKVG